MDPYRRYSEARGDRGAVDRLYGGALKAPLSWALNCNSDPVEAPLLFNGEGFSRIVAKAAADAAANLAAMAADNHACREYAAHQFAALLHTADASKPNWAATFIYEAKKALRAVNTVRAAEYTDMLDAAIARKVTQPSKHSPADTTRPDGKYERRIGCIDTEHPYDQKRIEVMKANKKIGLRLVKVRPRPDGYKDPDYELSDSDEDELLPRLKPEDAAVVHAQRAIRKRAREELEHMTV